MKKMIKKITVMVLIAVMTAAAALLAGCGESTGGGSGSTDSVMKDAAEYLVENVAVDSFDSMGGGWVPLALKLSGTDAADEDYYTAYYDSIRAAVKSNGDVLSENKPTANERVSMNLKALGKDPTNVEGGDLMKVADDADKVKRQGLNAEIYALIAADYVGYELENEDDYLYDIIVSQIPDGSFGLDSDHPDADMTAMAVQALSIYDSRVTGNSKSDPRAEGAIDRALDWLSQKQLDRRPGPRQVTTAAASREAGCDGAAPR